MKREEREKRERGGERRVGGKRGERRKEGRNKKRRSERSSERSRGDKNGRTSDHTCYAEKPRGCIVCFVFMDCIEIIVYHTVN